MAARRDVRMLAPVLRWGRVSGRLGRRGFWPLAIVLAVSVFGALYFAQIWLLLPAYILFWPVIAAAVRRLHDVERSGWWLLLAFVPLVNLCLVLMLLRRPSPRARYFRSYDEQVLPNIAVAMICGVLMVLSLTVKVIVVPNAAMKPAIMPGDVVAVWRWSYGEKLAACAPFDCPLEIVEETERPERGDVISMVPNNETQTRTARVIGLPSEQVSFANGAPVLNGLPFRQENNGIYTEVFEHQGPMRVLPRCRGAAATGIGAPCVKTQLREELPTGKAYIVLDADGISKSDQRIFTVPEDHIFVLGDNRDHATDSRLPAVSGGAGFVPMQTVIGRVQLVLWSVDGQWWQIWRLRPERVLKRVR